ncbi:MAG: MYXO-CTERM domain-containing protein, partial [Kiritimatiellia bacterium]
QPIDDEQARWLLDAQIRSRLRGRHTAGLSTSTDQARRLVIEFEAYKARSYLTSGVYPRRYFGYLDAQGDTASDELKVVRAIRASTDASNVWLAEQQIPWRVTDQELAVTWIAEGGALLLADPAAAKRPVHAVYGIGLDDIAHGFKELPGLVGRLDTAASTHVEQIPAWKDGHWTLTRDMTLEESVVGTAVMWVWEKRIADRKLKENGRPAMHTYDATDQFILASLVYNSGLIHSPSRPAHVRNYTLANHLSGLAAKHNKSRRHAHLPVLPASESLAQLLVDLDYPYQGTSWIALYHIQQRFGGYDALARFSDTFDADGRFVDTPWNELKADLQASQLVEAARQKQARSTQQTREDNHAAKSVTERELWCGCSHGPAPLQGALWLIAVGLVARRRRQGAVSIRPSAD